MKAVKLKMNMFGIKLELDTMNNINLLTGKNGTGKTLVNKAIFVATNALFLESSKREMPLELQQQITPEAKSKMHASLFEISPEEKGEFEVHFEGGTEVHIKFEGNNFTEEFKYLPLGKFKATMPIYITTQFRNFRYVHKVIKDTKNATSDEELLEDYPICDVNSAILMINNCTNNPKIEGALYEMLNEGVQDPYIKLVFNMETDKFIAIKESGKEVAAEVLGAGEQALLIMHKTIQ